MDKRPSIIKDFSEIDDWLAGKGDKDIIYHTGDLASNREIKDIKTGGLYKNEPLNGIASYLMALSDENQVTLYQRRVKGLEGFVYYARRHNA